MQIPLHLSVRDIPASKALDARIREKVEALEQGYPFLAGCRVIVEMPHKHKHQGRLINVTVEMRVSQGALTVNRHAREDAYVAVREVFDAAQHRLEDYLINQQTDVQHNTQLIHGHVTRLFDYDGYGFIETDEGQEYYFSRDNVTDSIGFSKMRPGMEVQFIEGVEEGYQAKRVSADRHHAP